jgi:hypothetical protein
VALPEYLPLFNLEEEKENQICIKEGAIK